MRSFEKIINYSSDGFMPLRNGHVDKSLNRAKAFIRYVLFSLLLIPFEAHAIPDDKLKHALAGFGGQILCEVITSQVIDDMEPFMRSAACFVMVAAAGAAKELTDPSRGDSLQAGDFYADIIGAGIAIPIIKLGF